VNRKRIIYVSLALLVIGLAWCGVHYWRSRPPKPNVPIAVFGSQQAYDALLGASDITAERLHYRRESPEGPWRLVSYDRDVPISVTAEQANTIREVFAQESTYGWELGTLCAPIYGVIFTARSGQSTVRIALCFDCYLVGVYDSADGTAMPVNRENNFVWPASRSLVSLVKDLFPNDSDMQSLK
jgi:hypothetical protein